MKASRIVKTTSYKPRSSFTVASTLLAATLATCYGHLLEPAEHTLVNRHQISGAHERPTRTRGNSIGRLARAAGQVTGDELRSVRNITAQNGHSVLLHCPVEPSGELSVSWFRGTGDLQVLTYQTDTIILDERFIVLVKEDDWALLIKSLDRSDSGLYQCQTNSDPPLSQYYQLNVVEPQVNILGAPDMAVKSGANINLTCVISQSPDQQQFIFWYRDQKMINYQLAERGKIVQTKTQKADTLISTLQIFNSRLSDSANYTCAPSGSKSTSIYVHVLEASSQQTNSAISVHVMRLSQGRVYALLTGYFLVASWYQLVAQAQTAISLVLLAIIGLFLGQLTDDHQQQQQQQRQGGAAKRSQFPADSDHTSGELADEEPSTANTLRPLMEPGLKLLQTLGSSSSSIQQDDPATTSGGQVKPLTSPSASSASNSTGYNSDSRSVSAPLGPEWRLVVGAPLDERGGPTSRDEPGAMLELVGQQPTALRLVMDNFGRRSPVTPPAKPSRLQASDPKRTGRAEGSDQEESPYSTPTSPVPSREAPTGASPVIAARN